MVKITDNIYCITTEYSGRKFNSYLITGEKNALVDSCPEECAGKLISAVAQKVSNLDYVIFTHTDRMRAGAVEKLSDTKIIATIAGLRNLKEIANKELEEIPAKDGAVIDLGGISLKFIITPNLNWPDTMMVYIPEQKVLLSGTAFVSSDYISAEAYLKSELVRFSDFVRTATEKAAALKPAMVCPSEGDIQTGEIFEIYREELKAASVSMKAGVLYSGEESGYTAMLAKTVSEAIRENGTDVICINCHKDNLREAVSAMNGADILCFASPTIHRNAMPEIMDVIARLDCVNMRHKPCMVTGSYGWGGEALGNISNYLKMLKMRVFEKPFGCIMKPSENELKELTDFTKRFVKFAEELYDNK